MKRTQIKDALRNIARQKVSYLSIIVIAFLGATSFLGLDYTFSALRQNGSAVYNRLNYRDIEMVSTLLFTEEDLDCIRDVEGVADAEGVLQTSAKLSAAYSQKDITVISSTERVNQVELLEGRLPFGQDECALEEKLATELDLHVGDTLEILDASGMESASLTGSRFLVTGIINHPDHSNLNVSEAPYVLVAKEAFNGEMLDSCFMKAEVIIEKPAGIDRFSAEYDRMVSEVDARLADLASSRTALRDSVFPAQLQERIDAGSEALKAAEEELAAGRETLETAWYQLENIKVRIRDTIRGAIEKFYGDTSAILPWATKSLPPLEDETVSAAFFPITETIGIDLGVPLNTLISGFIHSPLLSNSLLKRIYENGTGSAEGFDPDAMRTIMTNSCQRMAADYAEEYDQLSEACTAWNEGRSAYLNSLKQYKKALHQFEEAETMLSSLKPCRWLRFDKNGNAGFVQLKISSQSVNSIKSTFALLFIVIGAFVIFATVSKIIDEQRTLVGTTKALGFMNREVFAKYLSFGVSATFIGTLAGILAARFAFENFILQGFHRYYIFDLTDPKMVFGSTLLVILAGLILSAGAVWFACRRLIGAPAIRLMMPTVPPSYKGSGKGGKRNGPLYSRLILRNMRMDLRRVIVTIVSIAGCCALVVIGFTLRLSVDGSIRNQYSEIIQYDARVSFNPSVSDTVLAELESRIRSKGADCIELYSANILYHITDSQSAELFCGDLSQILAVYQLVDWKTGKPLAPADDGIFIQKRVAELYGLEPGSEFEISIGGTQTATVRVAGIFDHYIGRPMFMSPAYYETLFGSSWTPNTLFVNLNGTDAKALEENIRQVSGYERMQASDEGKQFFLSAIDMINTIVIVFILMAAVMAGVVLLNLTNIYILQKKRELVIMRINGFTVKEVRRYVLRETFLTTVLGIFFGLGLGSGIAYRLIRMIEQSFYQLDRRVQPLAWLIAIAMTLFFTTIVNLIALRPVRNLKLTDIG